MGARVEYREKERVSEARVVLELQGTPMWYSSWKRAPQVGRSPDVSPSWLPSQEAASLPWLSWSERITIPPLRDANLIIKPCKVWKLVFVFDFMTRRWNYSKRILKIKGAKGTMRNHKEPSSVSMGNWLQESCATQNHPCSSLVYKKVWHLEITNPMVSKHN